MGSKEPLIASCFYVFEWEVVSDGDLHKQNDDSEESLSEGNQQLLCEVLSISQHNKQQSLYDVLLNDHHENDNRKHVSIWEGILSLCYLILEFLKNWKHVHDNEYQGDLDDVKSRVLELRLSFGGSSRFFSHGSRVNQVNCCHNYFSNEKDTTR